MYVCVHPGFYDIGSVFGILAILTKKSLPIRCFQMVVYGGPNADGTFLWS